MDDPWSAVATFASKLQGSSWILVEMGLHRLQLAHCFGGLAHERLNRCSVTQTSARREGVLDVVASRVL
jgi:hypothetical protein